MTENPNGRFHKIDAPALPPGEDFLTRSTVGPFVDTGVDLAWGQRGRVYLTVDTIRELASVAGLFDNLVSTEVVDSAETAYKTGYVDALKEKLDDNLRDAVAELMHVLRPDDGGGAAPVAEGASGKAEPVAVNDTVSRRKNAKTDLKSDISDSGSVKAGNAKAAKSPASSGKGNGAGSKRRPVVVSGDSGDGDNPFQL